MFFVLSKVLLFLTVPLTWILGFCAYAWWTKNAIRRKRALLCAFISFLFFSNQIVFDEFMRSWEVGGLQDEELEHYDVAIVLGGMAWYNNDLKRINFHNGSDRLWQAVRLYKMGKVDKLMICGDSGSLIDDGLDEAKQLKAYLLSIGFPEEDILIETTSKNTHENAQNAAKILEQVQGDQYLLVTSAYHMRRALACFNKEGIVCTPYSTDHFTGERWFTFERLFMPNLKTLDSWKVLTKEWTGTFVYWMMDYI